MIRALPFIFLVGCMVAFCAPHSHGASSFTLYMVFAQGGHVTERFIPTEAACRARAAEWAQRLTPAERATAHYECRP